MCLMLAARINADLEKTIIAKFHDESHLNRFRLDNKEQFNILHPKFAFPGNIPPDQFSHEPAFIHAPANKAEILSR